MPFTPTHVLAVVPIASLSKRLPFSALAIGCMMPDLPLFFPTIGYAQTHSLSGVFVYCLPLGLMAFMLFQAVLKVPLMALLPEWVQKRMTAYSRPLLKPSYWFFCHVCIAVVIGAATHLSWDAFTHEGRWGTHLVPWLNTKTVLLGREVEYFKIAQHGCTLVGLPLMLWFGFRKLLATPQVDVPEWLQVNQAWKLAAWSILIGLPSLVASKILVSKVPIFHRMFLAVTDSGALFMLLTLGYALLYLWITKWPRIVAGSRPTAS